MTLKAQRPQPVDVVVAAHLAVPPENRRLVMDLARRFAALAAPLVYDLAAIACGAPVVVAPGGVRAVV
jgi:hypothetical protein